MSVHRLRKGLARVVLGAALVAVGCGSGDSEFKRRSAAQGGGPGVARRCRSPRRPRRGRRASASRRRSARTFQPARRSPSSAAASRPARSRATSSSRAPPTSAGPPRRSAPTARPSSSRTRSRRRCARAPTRVILNAVNRDAVAKQIEKAEQQGVAFVTCCSIESEGDGILRNVAGKENSARIGENLAAQIVADSERQGEHAVRQHLGLPDPAGARRPDREPRTRSSAPTASTPRSTSR